MILSTFVCFLDADTVAFSNSCAAVEASEKSASKSPNNLKSGTGPKQVNKNSLRNHLKIVCKNFIYLTPKKVKVFGLGSSDGMLMIAS